MFLKLMYMCGLVDVGWIVDATGLLLGESRVLPSWYWVGLGCCHVGDWVIDLIFLVIVG